MTMYIRNAHLLGLGSAGLGDAEQCAKCDPTDDVCKSLNCDSQFSTGFDPAAACIAGGGSKQSCCTANPSSPACAGTSTPNGGNSSGSTWWQSGIVASVGALPAVLNAVGLGPKVPKQPTLIQATPWYMTPLGLGAIAVAGLVGYKLFLKD